MNEQVQRLIAGLEDPDTSVRWSSAWALGEIGPAAAEAVPALTVALWDADKDVRDAAEAALKKIRGP